MNYEELLEKYFDGTATSDECREVLEKMQADGILGDVLVSEAASLFACSREELEESFSPAEVEEIEAMRRSFASAGNIKPINYASDEDDYKMVAEDEAPYGN